MNVIMAGTRTITDPALLEQAVIDSGYEVEIVFCGCADGVDKMSGHCHDTLLGLWINAEDCEGADWGMEHGWACTHGVAVRHFPADWKTHGKAAGPIRNREMAEAGADALLALWDGESKGTSSMIQEAVRAGIKHFYITWPRKEGDEPVE